MSTQLPSQQTNPDGQELPQAPQLLSLDERSTQNPPQSVSPWEPQVDLGDDVGDAGVSCGERLAEATAARVASRADIATER